MSKDVKVIDLIDEDGFRLPGNLNTQFRNLQGGVEYLKDSADNITLELKGVSKKLGKHTTDLSTITEKVNEIDKNLKDLSKVVSENFTKVGETFDTLIKVFESIANTQQQNSNKAKAKNRKK